MGITIAPNDQALASDVLSILNYGLAANIPAAAAVLVDSLYYETDTKILKQEQAGVWAEITRGETVIRLAQLAERAFASLTGRVGKSQMEWTTAKLLLGAGAGSDPTEIDVPTTVTLTVAETEVFNGLAPVAWTDLDLSGTIGSQATLVLLKIADTHNISDSYVAVRKNGDTDEFYVVPGVAKPMGAALGMIFELTPHIVLVVATDNSGVIEWRRQHAHNTTVDIIAYLK